MTGLQVLLWHAFSIHGWTVHAKHLADNQSPSSYRLPPMQPRRIAHIPTHRFRSPGIHGPEADSSKLEQLIFFAPAGVLLADEEKAGVQMAFDPG